MVTIADAVTSTVQTVEVHVKYNTATEHNPPEIDYCCGRGNGKPKHCYHCSVPVRPWSQQTPSLSYQSQTHAVSLLKKADSTVMEYLK